jgi:hypothetical protein
MPMHARNEQGAHGTEPAHAPAAHTVAYEAGGLSMLEFARVMRADGEAQDRLVRILSEMLDETVKRNDSLQV